MYVCLSLYVTIRKQLKMRCCRCLFTLFS